ncbi:MAG: ABC transporter permease [bacterium]|nr:ABC transporter permease [bacterium]
MRFAYYIARRYLRSRHHSGFLNRNAVLAIMGITIGVMVLHIVLAVMNGFEAEMRRTFVENMPMVTVHSSAPEGFENLGALMDEVSEDPDVLGVSPFIRKEVIVSGGARYGDLLNKGAVVWGIDPDLVDSVQPLSKYLNPDPIILGALKSRKVPRVILGSALANNLYSAVGDTVILTTAKGEFRADRMEAESRKFVVIGFFETGMYEFDSQFAYVDLQVAQEFFDYGPGGASLLGVKVVDLMKADVVSDRINDNLPQDYYTSNWMRLNQNLFKWIKTEKRVMFLLLGLIILIAGFNIMSILTMMVGERRREIGILMSMGTSRSQIMGIFLFNSLYLGVSGGIFGSILGMLSIAGLEKFGIPIPGDVYFLDTVPVLFMWTDFFAVVIMTLFVSLIGGLWPSFEASRFNPVEIIRYE